MRLGRRTVLRVIALTAALGFFAWTIRLAVSGGSGSGRTAIADVPYVGDKFNDFHAAGNVAYSYNRHPHGGGVVSLSGVIGRAGLTSFCESSGTTFSRGGTDIQSREDILEYLDSHFDQTSTLHGWPGRADAESMTLFCYAARFPKLYGRWDPDTQRFWIVADIHEGGLL